MKLTHDKYCFNLPYTWFNEEVEVWCLLVLRIMCTYVYQAFVTIVPQSSVFMICQCVTSDKCYVFVVVHEIN